MLDLDAIEKLLAEATPGPLTICLGSGEHLCTGLMNEKMAQIVCDFLPDYFLEENVKVAADHRPDMNLFLALRNAAPTLLALARAGREHYEEHKYCNEDCTCEEFVKEWREADGE